MPGSFAGGMVLSPAGLGYSGSWLFLYVHRLDAVFYVFPASGAVEHIGYDSGSLFLDGFDVVSIGFHHLGFNPGVIVHHESLSVPIVDAGVAFLSSLIACCFFYGSGNYDYGGV